MPVRRPASRRRVVRHNPEHVGEKIHEAVKSLRSIAADYRRQADEIEAAWSEGDYEWLHLAGVISSRDLDAVNEEREYLYGRNNPHRASRRRK